MQIYENEVVNSHEESCTFLFMTTIQSFEFTKLSFKFISLIIVLEDKTSSK